MSEKVKKTIKEEGEPSLENKQDAKVKKEVKKGPKPKSKKSRKPMSKNTKIILSCAISVVVVIGLIVGLVLGLNKEESIFDYITLEVKSATNTYAVTAVSPKLTGEVKIPSEYKGKAITIIDENAFYGSNVEKLILPDSITNFGYRAFMNSTKLKSINTPASLTVIGQECFLNCKNLKSFALSDVTNSICDSAFRNCQSLETFTFNEKISTIGKGAFGHCYKLESVTIPASVRFINGAIFTYCKNLTEIKVADGNTKYTSLDSNVIVEMSSQTGNKVISGCKTSVIPDGVSIIGDSAFEGIEGLEKITLPSTVTTLGACSFYGCTLLGSECDGFIDTSHVKTIGKMAFSNCDNLTRVELAGELESMGFGVYSNCDKLESVIISAPSLKEVSSQTFYNCQILKEVTISNNLDVIASYSFARCIALETLTISGTVNEIESYTFSECESLLSLYLPSSVSTIGEYAFFNCNENMVLKMGATEALSGYEDKFNYISETKQLTTEWGQTAD